MYIHKICALDQVPGDVPVPFIPDILARVTGVRAQKIVSSTVCLKQEHQLSELPLYYI